MFNSSKFLGGYEAYDAPFMCLLICMTSSLVVLTG